MSKQSEIPGIAAVIAAEMSDGWCTRPEPRCGWPRARPGDSGATTAKPAAAQPRRSRSYRAGLLLYPWANATSGNGPSPGGEYHVVGSTREPFVTARWVTSTGPAGSGYGWPAATTCR